MSEKLTALEHLRACAQAAKKFTGDVFSNFAKATSESIEELTETIPDPSDASPKSVGTASAGTSDEYARGDHVHPAQTSVTGNAGTATKLKTARSINGVEFDGSADIDFFGICSTSASTAAKIVSVSGEPFNLTMGAAVWVKFTYGNTATNATLNVNSTGAKSIRYYGTVALLSNLIETGAVYQFVYDGTYWQLVGKPVCAGTATPAAPTTSGSAGTDNGQYAAYNHAHPMQTTLGGYSTSSSTSTSASIPIAKRGTWTPTVTNGGTIGTCYGAYYRVGNLVHCWFTIDIDSKPSSSSTSVMYIGGLPYTISHNYTVGTSTDQYCLTMGSASLYSSGNLSFPLFPTAIVYRSSSAVEIQAYKPGKTIDYGSITAQDIYSLSSGTIRFGGEFTYITSSSI